MWKQFTVQGNIKYRKILDEIVREYNNAKRKSIMMTPSEASKKKNEGTVYFNLYGETDKSKRKPGFKVGDRVRINKYKRMTFDTGYTLNWSEEIFLISKVKNTQPTNYELKDLSDEPIKGSFYEPDL